VIQVVWREELLGPIDPLLVEQHRNMRADDGLVLVQGHGTTSLGGLTPRASGSAVLRLVSWLR
jgi:hypothetical protein